MSGKVGGPQLAAQQFGNRGAFCDVCDVACSSKDAYEAHIRGVKHQKVNSNFAIACSACVCVCVVQLHTYQPFCFWQNYAVF